MESEVRGTTDVRMNGVWERTTRTLAPNARGGRLLRNFDLTTPDDPCGLVTRLNKMKNTS